MVPGRGPDTFRGLSILDRRLIAWGGGTFLWPVLELSLHAENEFMKNPFSLHIREATPILFDKPCILMVFITLALAVGPDQRSNQCLCDEGDGASLLGIIPRTRG